MSRAKKYTILIISLLLPALLLYPRWLPWVGKFLVVSDPLQRVEALVILAGDENERVASGAALYRMGYSRWFIVTDMRLEIQGSQGLYSMNVKRKAMRLGVPAASILIAPGQVSTTYEEASCLRDFVNSQGFRSLIVVTSPFHTRRARMILSEAFRSSGVTLIIHSAGDFDYPAETWWQTPSARQLTGLEYAKILAHMLGCRDYNDCGPLPQEWLKIWQKNLSPE